MISHFLSIEIEKFSIYQTNIIRWTSLQSMDEAFDPLEEIRRLSVFIRTSFLHDNIASAPKKPRQVG